MSGKAVLEASGEGPTDVVLVCGKQRFPCHRNVLQQHSPYFKAMFNSNMLESRSSEINLQGTNASAVKTLIEYAYTNKFFANERNVHRTLEAAAMFQFDSVRNACIEYLNSKLSPGNCLSVMMLMDALGITDLHRRARQMALWDFATVCKKAEFLDLPQPLLYTYLSNDGLRVASEMDVFQCIERWVLNAPEEREQDFLILLTAVRFSQVSRRELHSMTRSSLVRSSQQCKELMKKIHALKIEKPSPRSSDSLGFFSAMPSLSVSLPFLNTDFSRGLVSRGDRGDGDHLRTAQQLLKQAGRTVPMVPVVVGHIFKQEESRDSIPDLAYYDPQTEKMVRMGGIKKVYTNSHVATGYRVCAVGQNIYVSGGEFLLGYSNWNLALWQYNTFTEVWHFASNLPQPRRHHSVCVLGNCIYFVGGIGRFRLVLNNVDCYNTDTGEWESCAPLLKATFSAACTAHDGKLYVMTSEVTCYDPKANSWTLMRRTKLPNQMGFHAALSHSNGIYLVGRHSRELILYFTDCTERRDDKVAYAVVGAFTLPSENACIIGDYIYSFASEDRCAVEMYDIATDSFSVTHASSDLATPNVCHGCFALPFYRE